MPGNKIHPSSRPKSKILILTLSLLAFSILLVLVSLSSRPSGLNSNPWNRPETSFVVSLEHFLIHKLPKLSSTVRDDTVSVESDESVRKLDEMMFENDNRLLNADPTYPISFPIKVYVYEMPRKFTYDMLWLFRNTYKETSNLTSNGSPVHRLIEQHSIDYWLWADLIAAESERLLKSVIRVHRQEEADLFYVPFFTTISFFLLEKPQCKALYRVKH